MITQTISIRMKSRALVKIESELRLLKEIASLLLLLRSRALLKTLSVVVVMLILLR